MLPQVDKKKPTIMFCGDDIRLHTGFGKQLSKIVSAIRRTNKYNIVRISCFPMRAEETFSSPSTYDGLLVPEQTEDIVFYCDASRGLGDTYGERTFSKAFDHYLPDIVFTINDLQNVAHIVQKKNSGHRFAWLHYTPVDGSPLPRSWGDVLSRIDAVIAYGKYGEQELLASFPWLESKIEIVPHAVDTGVYKPISDQDRAAVRSRMKWGDKIVYMYVGRTHDRKCIDRLLRAFNFFKSDSWTCNDCHAIQYSSTQTCPQCGGSMFFVPHKDNVHLYLHSPSKDDGKIDVDREIYKYNVARWVSVGGNSCVGHGVPEEDLADLMAAADVHVNTSYGEGWCLHPDTDIITAKGLLHIPTIESDGCNFAYGKDGGFWEIEQVMSRSYDGPIYSISTALDDTKTQITPEHTCFVLSKMKKTVDPFVCAKEELSEVPADKIYSAFKKGKDVYVPFPKPAAPAEIGKILVGGYSVDLVPVFGFFVGAYMACGTSSEKSVIFDLSLVPGQLRVNYRQNLVEAIYALDIAKQSDVSAKKTSVIVNNSDFCVFVQALFTKDNEVRFPHFWTIRSLYSEICRANILASGTKQKYCLRVQCSTYLSAWQTRFMLFDSNIVGYIKSIANRHYVDIKDKGKNLHNMALITKESYDAIRRDVQAHTQRDFIVGDNYILIKVTDIEKEHYRGVVYNLSVPGDLAYTTSQFLVHNCVPIHEAMATGKPVIVPDHSALSTDLVSDGYSGLTTPICTMTTTAGGFERGLIDEKTMAAQMDMLYYDDPEIIRKRWAIADDFECGKTYRNKLGKNARAFVSRYDDKIVAAKWVGIFDKYNPMARFRRTYEKCKEFANRDAPLVMYVANYFDPPVGGAEWSALSLLDGLAKKGLATCGIGLLGFTGSPNPFSDYRIVNSTLAVQATSMGEVSILIAASKPSMVISGGTMSPQIQDLLSSSGIHHHVVLNDFLPIISDVKYPLGYGAERDKETLLAYLASTASAKHELNYRLSMLKSADTISANSEWTKNAYRDRYGITASHVHYPFIRWNVFDPSEEEFSIDDKRHRYVIGMVRPIRSKGIATILALAEKFPHLIFKIIGPAIKEEPFIQASKTLGNVCWQPTTSQMRNEYEHMMMLLMPSVVEETFGMTAVEAMACDVPVVVSNRGALPEAVGDTVERICPTDVNKYAWYVEEMLKNEEALVSAVNSGRKRALEIKKRNEQDLNEIIDLALRSSRRISEKKTRLADRVKKYKHTPISMIIPCYRDLNMGIAAARSAHNHQKTKNLTVHMIAQLCDPYEGEVPSWMSIEYFDEALGWCAACNIGAEIAQSDIVVFANSDVLFGPYWDVALLDKMAPDVGVVAPITNRADYHYQQKSASFVNKDNYCSFAELAVLTNFGSSASTDRFIAFTFMCYRNEFVDMGGLDETFGNGGYDDNDLSIRIKLAGKKIVIANDCFVFHHGGVSMRSAQEHGYGYQDDILRCQQYMLEKHGRLS